MPVADVPAYDAQVHAWAADTPERPWFAKYAFGGGKREVPPDKLEKLPVSVLADMDAAGVTGAIIVPPSFENDRNDLALDAAHAHPDRFRIHARYPLEEASISGRIAKELADPGVLGVRMTFNAAAAEWIQDGTADWFWDFTESEGIPVSLYPVGEQLQLLDGIASAHPRLKLSIDHLATSVKETGYDTLDRIRELEPLGKRPNIAVKASALPISFPATYSVDVVREVVDLLLGWFGPERVFWGSDYTRLPDMADYGRTVETFRQGIAHLPAEEQRLVMGGALRSWFGWTDATG